MISKEEAERYFLMYGPGFSSSPIELEQEPGKILRVKVRVGKIENLERILGWSIQITKPRKPVHVRYKDEIDKYLMLKVARQIRRELDKYFDKKNVPFRDEIRSSGWDLVNGFEYQGSIYEPLSREDLSVGSFGGEGFNLINICNMGYFS